MGSGEGEVWVCMQGLENSAVRLWIPVWCCTSAFGERKVFFSPLLISIIVAPTEHESL